MEGNLQQFWLSIGVLVVIGVVAALWIASRLGKKPGDTVTGSVTPIAERPLPAPSYLGALLLKPIYQKGERLTFQTTQQVAGCDNEVVRYGVMDNNTGPYGVVVRAYEKTTGQMMPVYIHDGGPECSGVCVDSGVFDVYLLGKRPYDYVGSEISCNVFVPRLATTPVFVPLSGVAPKSCNPPQPVTGNDTLPEKVAEVVLEVTVANQYGSMSGPYAQIVRVDTTGCE